MRHDQQERPGEETGAEERYLHNNVTEDCKTSQEGASLPGNSAPKTRDNTADDNTGYDSESTAAIDVAFELLDLGLRPIPSYTTPDGRKKPYVSWTHLKERAPTEAEVLDWWRRWPTADIAIITGHAGGLCALDIDKLPDKHGKPKQLPNPWPGELDLELPVGCVLETPSGGKQYLFASPEPPIHNSEGKIAPGVDIRGLGGLTVIHGQGRRIVYGSLADALDTRCPDWLLEEIKNANTKKKETSEGEYPGTDPKKVLAGVDQGTRDETLFRYACRLRGKGYNRAEAEILVREAARNCQPPFLPNETQQKVDSAWKYTPEAAKKRDGEHSVTFDPGQATLSGSVSIFRYHIDQFGLAIQCRSVYRYPDGRLTASIRVEPEQGDAPLPGSGRVTLSSHSARTQLAERLERPRPLDGNNWEAILDHLYIGLEDSLLAGEPWIDLSTDDVPEPKEYLLYPLLPKGESALVYGSGESAKSLFAMLIGLVVSSGKIRLGLELRPTEAARVAYLDWERHPDEAKRRIYRLARGLGMEQHTIKYRRFHRSLAEDFDEVAALVAEEGIELLIIDSLLSAAGLGDGRDPASAPLSFFRALNQLGVTALVIAHPGKNVEKGVYSSVFFENLTSSVWEASGSRSDDGSEAGIVLRHKKANVGPHRSRIAVKFTFDDSEGEHCGPITVESCEPEEVPTATDTETEEAGLRGEIFDLLCHSEPLGPMEVSKELGADYENVKKTMSRMKNCGLLVQPSRGKYTVPMSRRKEEVVDEIPF